MSLHEVREFLFDLDQEFDVALPEGAVVLELGFVGLSRRRCMWALCPVSAPSGRRRFRVVETSERFDLDGMRYVSSLTSAYDSLAQLGYHLFEVLR